MGKQIVHIAETLEGTTATEEKSFFRATRLSMEDRAVIFHRSFDQASEPWTSVHQNEAIGDLISYGKGDSKKRLGISLNLDELRNLRWTP